MVKASRQINVGLRKSEPMQNLLCNFSFPFSIQFNFVRHTRLYLDHSTHVLKLHKLLLI